jgi:starch-binding outer membrane protein, SusD/RagB family
MKNRLSVFVLIIIISGCQDFLLPKPDSLVVPENMNDPELLVRGAFQHLRSNNDSWKISTSLLLNYNNDEIISNKFRGTNGSFWDLSTFSQSTSNNELENVWVFLFGGVNASNHAVISAQNNENIELEAEARFIRGFYYYTLATLFGGVPLVDSYHDDPYTQRSNMEETLHFIEDDWIFATENGPEVPVMAGRITRYTAAGYLAKLYLFMGGCIEHNVDQWIEETGDEERTNLLRFSNWADSRTPAEYYVLAENLLTGIYGKNSLIDNYRDNFRKGGEDDAREHEWLFNIECSATMVGGLPQAISWQSGFHMNSLWWHIPNYELFDMYHENDVRRGNTAKFIINGERESVNGAEHWVDNIPNRNGGINQYIYGKWRQDLAAGLHRRWLTGGLTLLRYADVVLMLAETKFYNGKEGEARELLEEVRLRATSSTGDKDETILEAMTTQYYNSDFMQELMDERKRELCAEGLRRVDLIRTGRMVSAINSLTDKHPNGNEWNQGGVSIRAMKENLNNGTYKIWFPIPQQQISVAGFLQNPGYPVE